VTGRSVVLNMREDVLWYSKDFQSVHEILLTVQNVFLVGGFAESPYVQEELRSFLKYRNISVLIPDTA